MNRPSVGATEPPPKSAPSTARRSRFAGAVGWLSGLLLLIALVTVVMRFTEIEQFAMLVRDARPMWLVVGLALQATTYVCAAAILHRALAQQGMYQSLAGLIPLGLAKLFTDQAVPSVGISGTLLMLRTLERRGVPRGISIGAMLNGLVTYYIAYGVIVMAALAVLWRHGEITRIVLVIAAVFALVVTAVPIGVLWLRGRVARRLPTFVTRMPAFREALAGLTEAPPDLMKSPRLLAELTLLQLAIFLLDAATLGMMMLAVASPVEADIVLASFAIASVAATLGWVPGGLGTFDATCVGMLHWHGSSLEAALAGTLLLRGLTFWLPMVPGVWLARRALRGADES